MTDDKNERIEARLLRIVKSIPGEDGWYKTRGENYYMDLGRLLLKLGVGLTEIEYQLGRVYLAAAEEFGG